jgi:hypothetical protein
MDGIAFSRSKSIDVVFFFLLIATAFAAGKSQAAKTGTIRGNYCAEEAAYRKLDFWIGRWEVFNLDGTKAGRDVVEKVMNGCAIVENWSDIGGSQGMSLFYYQPVKREWKQVWVTDMGPMKEKILVADFSGSGIRFQGTIPHSDGTTTLDRTTLTPVSINEVRQLIEVSYDKGTTWRTTFDAIYRRAK